MNTFLMQASAQAENRFYGHIHLLAQYCGFEGQPWLNGYLQHGWNATDGFGNYLGGKRVSNKYVWSKRCEDLIRKKGKKNVFAIGAPWIYLEDVYPQKKNSSQSGTIAYPAHSSGWSKMGDTNKEYAQFLKDKYGEVMVVLHRYDHANEDTRKNYESFGHSVTTHGVGTPWEKGFDQQFLKNQRDIMSGFATVVSNSMSTAILYATSLGLKPEIGGPISYSTTHADDKASQTGDGSINWNEKIMEPENQMNLWKNELGLDCKKSPQELGEILGWIPQPKKSISFFIKRSIDLVSGSSQAISLKVLKSVIAK
jgi:hypothetical protein